MLNCWKLYYLFKVDTQVPLNIYKLQCITVRLLIECQNIGSVGLRQIVKFVIPQYVCM